MKNKIAPIPILLLMLFMLQFIVLPAYAVDPDFSLSVAESDLADYIEEAKLKFYLDSDEATKAELKVDITLDSEAINDEIIDGLTQIEALMDVFDYTSTLTSEQRSRALTQYFVVNPNEIPDISCSFKFKSADFTFSSYGENIIQIDVDPISGDGKEDLVDAVECSFDTKTEDETEYTYLTFTLLPSALWVGVTDFGEEFSLTLNAQEAIEPKFTISLLKNEIQLEVIDNYNPTPKKLGGDDPVYTVTKMVQTRETNSFFISYNIDVSVENGYLDGYYFVDFLPDTRVQLVSASVQLEGEENLTELDIKDYNTTYNGLDNTFVYSFADENKCARASFNLTYCLTKDAFDAYVQNKLIDITITNRAELWDDADSTTIAISGPVSANIKETLMSKDGKQNTYNKQLIDWTINLSTSFSHTIMAYIVDTCDASKHDYTIGDYATVTRNDSDTFRYQIVDKNKEYQSYVEMMDGSDPADITANELHSNVTSHIGNQAGYVNHNGTSYLFIPIVQSRTDNEHTNFDGDSYTVTYQTKMKPTGDDYNNDMIGAGDKVELVNQAKLIYSHMCIGNNPGNHEYTADFSIGKTVETSYEFFTKSAGGYDKNTQTITWNFDVNRYGGSFSGAYISDPIPEGLTLVDMDNITLTILDITDKNATPKKVKLSSISEPKLPYANEDAAKQGYYYDTDNRTLYINLGPVSNNQIITFSIKTAVSDVGFLASQETDRTFKNKSTATYTSRKRRSCRTD